MAYYIGLDVSLEETSICVIDDHDKVISRKTALSNPDDITKAIKTFKNVNLIGLESGSMSHFLTAELRKRIPSTPVICVDALHLSGFLNLNLNKTDKHDAEGIAQALRCKRYKEVIIKTEEQLNTRSLLTSRHAIVKARHNITNTLRGTVKTMGFVLPPSTGKAFQEQLAKILTQLTGDAKLGVKALVDAIDGLTKRIHDCDQKLLKTAAGDKRAQHLQQIPGVGPIVALSFLTDIGDPRRFKKSSSVGAYFGLTSRKYSSGKTDIDKGISKRGPKGTRTLLVTAAKAMLRTRSWCALKSWGLAKWEKKTYKQATTAMARKIAETMHCMLITQEDFRYTNAPKDNEKGKSKRKRTRSRSASKTEKKVA